jgi:hypothetical protein
MFAAATGGLVACTGFAFESTPGGDGPTSSLSTGGIAVDPRTETAFVLRRATSNLESADGGAQQGIPGGPIFAIAPDTGSVTKVADLTGYGEVRVLFPQSSMMIIGERPNGGGNRLMRFDETTLAMTTSVDTSANYWGTRTSPSGKYVAVADNSQVHPPIHVIDADTLDRHVLTADGLTLEAMWLRNSDTLVAAYFPNGTQTIGSARIVTWSVPELEAKGYPQGNGGIWSLAKVDITVPKVGFDFWFSYTWVGISPDDSLAVFPVITQDEGGALTHELLVMDTSTGALRTVPNAYGPVGFTPDGTTIVSYRYGGPGERAQLLLIDTATLVPLTANIPGGAAPSYFVTREGNDVVVASNLGLSSLVLYDVSNHKFEKLGGPSLGLADFVSRMGHDEVWLVDNGLFRLDFATAKLKQIPISWTPDNVDILPKRDLLVLDDADSGDIRYFDPSTLSVTRTVKLPIGKK